MDAKTPNEPAAAGRDTTVERRSDRELVVTRTFDAPARIVFEAWSRPELFRLWWTPKSFGMTIVSCEMDVRTGGAYRLEICPPGSDRPLAFYGRYLDVTPGVRIVWTNDEAGEGVGPVTTVTFEEADGRTQVVLRDVYPSKEALDEAMVSGATSGFGETFEQLDALLARRS